MAENLTDVRNGARPNSARATGTRSAGGTSLACDSLAGWPTTPRVVHFVTYQIDSDSNPIAGTQLDCTGVVTSNTINSFTVIDGSDSGNSVNDVVEMLPTAAWGQALADWGKAEHNRDGTHSAITPTSVTSTGNIQSATALVSDTVSEKTAATGVTVDGLLIKDGYPKALAKDQLTTDSNPYKFLVYRSAAWTSSNGSFGKVTFDTETFDTNSNFSGGTYTAPVTGFYEFNWRVQSTVSNGAFSQTSIYKNGVSVAHGSGIVNGNSSFLNCSTGAVLLNATAGDTFEIYYYASGGAGSTSQSETSFNGHLVSRT